MAALATTADLDARGITYDDLTGAVVVDALLDEASAIVRDAAGAPISEATSAVTLVGYRHQTRIRLPGPPIQSVSTVTIDGETVTDWRLEHNTLWRQNRWSDDYGPATVVVTMTHGLPTVPDDIVGLVCSMVAAGLKAARAEDNGTGLAARDPAIQSTSEQIDDYSTTTTYATGRDSRGSTVMDLPRATRDRLRARFGGGATTVASQ